jgi:hypothetical protein
MSVPMVGSADPGGLVPRRIGRLEEVWVMKGLRKYVGVTVLSVLFAGVAAPALAQAPPNAEVAAGYQFLRGDGENLKKGWFAEIAVNMPKIVSLVGQVSGSHMSLSETMTVGTSTISANGSASLYEFLGGVRFSSRKQAKAVPFAQVLAGGVRAGAKATATLNSGGVSSTQSVNESDTEFGVQAGGGFNFYPGQRVGVRVGFDYIRVFHKGNVGATNFFRFTAGAVIPLGKR